MMQEDDHVEKDERYSYIESKASYSSNVLTGDWVTARWQELPQKTTTIVPCISTENTGCEQHLTTSQDDYSLKEFDPNDMTRVYMEAKVGKFGNSKAQRTSVKYLDAEKFNNNYTSLNTLVYELWPKMLQEENAASATKKQDAAKHSKLDTLDSFGTHSSIKRPDVKEPLCPVATSYKLDFSGRQGSPAKSAKMKDMIERL
ncbi:GH16766 [Drosophila grimshawi]|uniref:GH16766 n=1 Tax=Drosophila grimshawi TaxID=7222 RepID=B4J3Q7_DROGR|nr:GH16766 [Drosophila grimshawi]